MTETSQLIVTREWAMPSPHTFSIPPISALLDRWLPSDQGTIVDPCSGNSTRAGCRNDLRDGMDACDWLDSLIYGGRTFSTALLDPPYSPRQIAEVYKGVGRQVTTSDTQSAALYKKLKDRLDVLLEPGGIAITFGWNTVGFGKVRGYELLEILIVCHGGAHNDTLVTVERKIQGRMDFRMESGNDNAI